MNQPEPEPLMQIFVLNGTRTSAGPGPGPMQLPASECSRLLSMKMAVPGSRAPEAADPEPLVRTFGGPIPPARPAHSN